MANDEWVDRLPHDETREAEFERLAPLMKEKMQEFTQGETDPHALHYFADYWNWDGGTAPLSSIIRNPACDLSTARLIFWRAEPSYCQQFERRDEVPGWHAEVWDLIQEILSRVADGKFGAAVVPYDPREDGASIAESDDYKWKVPLVLREAFP